jgi:hypothetical protein
VGGVPCHEVEQASSARDHREYHDHRPGTEQDRHGHQGTQRAHHDREDRATGTSTAYMRLIGLRTGQLPMR